jgi:hypothetical protein
MLNASNSTAAIPSASTRSDIGSLSSQVRMIFFIFFIFFSTLPIVSDMAIQLLA